MRIVGLGLAAAAMLLAGPGRAQTNEGAARCEELLAPLASLLPDKLPTAEVGPGSCTLRDVAFRYSRRFGFEIGSLILKAPPTSEMAEPLLHRRLELHEVVATADTSNANADWLLRQQQAPVDVVLDVSEDHTAHTLTVNELSIQGEDVGREAFDAVVERVGGDDTATGLPDLSAAGLRSVHLRSDSKQFFARFLLPVLIGTWSGGDPAAEMTASKLQATDGARGLMQLTQTTPASVDAVLAFIHDLPKPGHVLDLSIVAKAGPFTDADLDEASASMMGLATVLSMLGVKATYDGNAH